MHKCTIAHTTLLHYLDMNFDRTIYQSIIKLTFCSAVKPDPAPTQIITNGAKDNQEENKLDEQTILKNRERLFNRTKTKKVEKSP